MGDEINGTCSISQSVLRFLNFSFMFIKKFEGVFAGF